MGPNVFLERKKPLGMTLEECFPWTTAEEMERRNLQLQHLLAKLSNKGSSKDPSSPGSHKAL